MPLTELKCKSAKAKQKPYIFKVFYEERLNLRIAEEVVHIRIVFK